MSIHEMSRLERSFNNIINKYTEYTFKTHFEKMRHGLFSSYQI